MNVLIAETAIYNNVILVTNNTKYFAAETNITSKDFLKFTDFLITIERGFA